MWKEIFWVFPAGRKGCRRGRGQERLVWEAPRGWGPAGRTGQWRGGAGGAVWVVLRGETLARGMRWWRGGDWERLVREAPRGWGPTGRRGW